MFLQTDSQEDWLLVNLISEDIGQHLVELKVTVSHLPSFQNTFTAHQPHRQPTTSTHRHQMCAVSAPSVPPPSTWCGAPPDFGESSLLR